MSATVSTAAERAEAGENRRGAPRRYFKATACLHQGEHGLARAITGRLLNVSQTGAALLARGAFAEGERLYVALLNPYRETVTESRGTVRWLSEEAGGVYRLGVAFDQALTSDQIALIA